MSGWVVVAAVVWSTASVAVPESVDSDLADAVAELDQAFAERGAPQGLERLEAATSQAQARCGSCFEVLWRSARTRFWQAESSQAMDAKGRFGKEGWDLAEHAIAQDAVRVEGFYYAAINIGIYSEAVGIWAALTQGLEGKFLERVRRALSIAPNAERSGPLLALGRYYYNMPWPKRDLKRASSLFRRALDAHPDNLRAAFYLAQALLQEGKYQDAEVAMSWVFDRPITGDPADGERIQSWAVSTRDEIRKALRR